MDVAAWLRELGLECYEPAFRENEIDWEVLPELTEGDLEKLGLPLGPRKKMVKAIAGLSGKPRAVSTEAAPSPRPVAPDAERRQLTVMFVDLVGSTALSTKLDPEDLREVMRTYQAACAKAIARLEGHVARFLGDGVLAYFGWPKAHEDDAERAVRAGLAIVDEIRRLRVGAETRLAARIGLATGEVVVGDLTSQDASDKDWVIGETPNLAARLQTLAEPGTVVISQATRRLVGDLFELDNLGPKRLKGFAEPLVVWRVSGERQTESRFEALRGRALTPLVGRERELAILLDCWACAKSGDGQVVLLSGEAGIGKSRLLHALRERLVNEPHLALSYFCSSYHANSALYPVITQLERAAGLAPVDPPEARLAKLEALVGQTTDGLDDAVPLLAALLSIPTGERYAPLELSPERQKDKLLELLINQLENLAREQPILLRFEDIHWIDPTSLELLDRLVPRIETRPVLALLTYRPEFQPASIGRAHVRLITLDRLARRHTEAMVEQIAGGKPLAQEVANQIVARTDGVPLFIEELTKTVLESDLLTDAANHFVLKRPSRSPAIPSSLRDSLMARLDRLPAVKEVAQIASVIGRSVPYQVLAAVVPFRDAELQSALRQLVRSELLFSRGEPPETIYVFKHALAQDAAYKSLLRSRRALYHLKIGEAIEKSAHSAIDSRSGILAHHFLNAAAYDRAFKYLVTKGRLAYSVHANQEASEAFSLALEALKQLPDSANNLRERIELSIRLGSVDIFLGRFEGALQLLAEAREVAEQLRDDHLLTRVLTQIGRVYYVQGHYPQSNDCYKEALKLAKRIEDHHRITAACNSLGNLRLADARISDAIEMYKVGLREQEAIGNRVGQAQSYTLLATAYARAGQPESGALYARIALEYAEKMRDNTRALWALLALAQCHACLGDLGQLELTLDRAKIIYDKVGDHRILTKLYAPGITACLDTNDRRKAMLLARAWIPSINQEGFYFHEIVDNHARAAALLLLAGDLEDAFRHAHQSVELAKRVPLKLELGSASMVLAELHACDGPYRDDQKAMHYLDGSFSYFEQVGTRLDFGRAHLAAARMNLRANSDKAREHAKAAQVIFAERKSCLLFAQAKQLLDRLI